MEILVWIAVGVVLWAAYFVAVRYTRSTESAYLFGFIVGAVFIYLLTIL